MTRVRRGSWLSAIKRQSSAARFNTAALEAKRRAIELVFPWRSAGCVAHNYGPALANEAADSRHEESY